MMPKNMELDVVNTTELPEDDPPWLRYERHKYEQG